MRSKKSQPQPITLRDWLDLKKYRAKVWSGIPLERQQDLARRGLIVLRRWTGQYGIHFSEWELSAAGVAAIENGVRDGVKATRGSPGTPER